MTAIMAAKWLRARARIDECAVSRTGPGRRSGISRIKPVEGSRRPRQVCHTLLTFLCRPVVLGGQPQSVSVRGDQVGGPRLRGGISKTWLAADRMDSEELGPFPDRGIGSRAAEEGGRGRRPGAAGKQRVISRTRKGEKVFRIGRNPPWTHQIPQILRGHR
jgi:hypothetical protein